MDIIIHNHYRESDKTDKQLLLINQKLEQMANSISEISAKVDTLQAALDTEQEQIKAALDKLVAANEELKVLVAEGGTAEERQALADKIDGIITDLQATIPDEVPPVEG